jgi:hypothetical protein
MTLSDSDLDRRLAALTRQAAPPAAVWERIDQRIRQPRRPWLPVAAAATVAALGLGLVLLLANPWGEPAHRPGSQQIAAEIQAMRQGSPEHHWRQPTTLNGGLEQAWEDNQAAIAELEKALERNPDNTLLLEFLVRARLRQSELINHSAAVANPQPPWSI